MNNNKLQRLGRNIFLLVLVFLYTFSVIGCKDGDSSHSYSSSLIGLDGFSESDQLRIQASHQVCFVGNSVSFAVTCRNNGGILLKDVEVLFNSDNGWTFSDSTVLTNDFGTAGVTFTPANAGTTKISIAANGLNKDVILQVYPSNEVTKPCYIYASSDSVKTSKTLTIQVFVCNSSVTGIKDAEVSVQCDYGTFPSGKGEPEVPVKGNTDDYGWFSTVYTAPNEVGVDVITAMAQGSVASVSVSVQWEDTVMNNNSNKSLISKEVRKIIDWEKHQVGAEWATYKVSGSVAIHSLLFLLASLLLQKVKK